MILLSFWLVLQHTTRQGAERSLAEQEASKAVLLHALEDTVVRSFYSIFNSLHTLADTVSQQETAQDIVKTLKERLQLSPQLRAIDLIDMQGNVLSTANSTAPAQQSPECLKQLKLTPSTEFFIDTPRKGRHPGDLFAEQSPHNYIPLCIPITNPEGELTKVVVASISPQYFYNLFTSITNSLSSFVQVYRYDGEELLSTADVKPDIHNLLQQVRNKSWGQSRTQLNDKNYLVSFRSTSLLPLIVVLVSDEAHALAAWRHDEKMMRYFLLVISLIIILATTLIIVLREKRLRAQDDIHLLSTAIKSTANAIFITDKHGDISWVNAAFSQLTGYSFDEIQGRNPRFLKSDLQTQSFYANLWDTILSGKIWRGEVVNRHKLGHNLIVDQTITPILNNKQKIAHFIAVHEDMTARKSAEKKAAYLASHDPLTGLPNRRHFEQSLQQQFTRSAPAEVKAVLLIDLDRFKDINDTMGHKAGDALLVHTANSLQALMTENHLLARLGGDEFAILIKKIEGQEKLASFASRVVLTVTKTFDYLDKKFNVTCSVGVATGHSQTTDASQILRQADMAMYRAKTAGKNTFRFFDEDMDVVIKRRVYLQQQLEQAVRKDTAFSLRYQPQVNTLTGAVTGAEALIRWEVNPGEWVSPAEFIPLAEESGHILPIGNWLLNNVFEQIANWNAQGVNYGTISINVSSVQLARDDLAKRILELMHNYAITAEQLCVEITETTLMTNSTQVVDNLTQLQEAGINLAIDDFGTGYSSMSYLKAIDAKYLKIDRSFIIGIGTASSDEHIVRATIALAHNLNLETIAEGVDSQEQLDFLRSLSCDYIQGYFFAKPLLPDEFEQFIQTHSARR